MARGKSCGGWCIYKKTKKTAKHKKGHWVKLFGLCPLGCNCPKPPPDSIGKPGDVWRTVCRRRHMLDTNPIPVCSGSCNWEWKNGNWHQDTHCPDENNCFCETPPDPDPMLGFEPVQGDNYQTDCLPKKKGRAGKRK
jgi:hypothetical protein